MDVKHIMLEDSEAIMLTFQEAEESITEAISLLDSLENFQRIFTCGAGACACVAKAIAGMATETGISCYPLTNDLAEAQPISYCKGGYESENSLAKHYSKLIKEGDILITISASGETGFVYSLADLAKQNGAWVIAITENKDSSLARNSNIVILTKGKPEAPVATKTQICQLAVGHALIMGLAQRRGLTEKDMIDFMKLDTIPSKPMGAK